MHANNASIASHTSRPCERLDVLRKLRSGCVRARASAPECLSYAAQHSTPQRCEYVIIIINAMRAMCKIGSCTCTPKWLEGSRLARSHTGARSRLGIHTHTYCVRAPFRVEDIKSVKYTGTECVSTHAARIMCSLDTRVRVYVWPHAIDMPVSVGFGFISPMRCAYECI